MNNTSDLINRHNIVQFFYDALPNLTISNSSTEDCMVYEVKNNLTIKRYVKENKYEFFMYVHAFIKIDDNTFNPSTGFPFQVEKDVNDLVKVIEYNDGRLDMISAAENDDWIYYTKEPASYYWYDDNTIDRLITKLNMSLSKLPRTDEEHFQQMTIDPLVIELKYCLMIFDIIDFINGIGSIVSVNKNMKIHLLFTPILRRDA